MPAKKRTRKQEQDKTYHGVEGSLQNFQLIQRNHALTLEVTYGEERIGKLEIGFGSLTWHPFNRKVRFKLDWQKFGKFMEEHGSEVPTK